MNMTLHSPCACKLYALWKEQALEPVYVHCVEYCQWSWTKFRVLLLDVFNVDGTSLVKVSSTQQQTAAMKISAQIIGLLGFITCSLLSSLASEYSVHHIQHFSSSLIINWVLHICFFFPLSLFPLSCLCSMLYILWTMSVVCYICNILY